MSLFIVTSEFYALLVASERSHSGVRRAFAYQAQKGRRMLTTNYVVIETCAPLQSRIGLEPVHDFESRLLPLAKAHLVDAVMHRRGFERLRRIDRRGVRLVDAVSFEVMGAEGVQEAFGLDADLKAEGYRRLP